MRSMTVSSLVSRQPYHSEEESSKGHNVPCWRRLCKQLCLQKGFVAVLLLLVHICAVAGVNFNVGVWIALAQLLSKAAIVF